MGTENTACHIWASHHPSGKSSRVSTRQSRLPLVVWCLLFALLPLQWGVIDDCHDSSSVSAKTVLRSVVSAFQPEHAFRQTRQHLDVRNQRGFPLPLSSVKMSPLFFSDKHIDVRFISNPKVQKGKRHRVTKKRNQNIHYGNSHKPLFGEISNAGNDDGEDSGPTDDDSDGKSDKKPSMKRVGGRRRRQKPPEYDDTVLNKESLSSSIKETKKEKFPLGGSLVIALLALTLLKNLFFGGTSDSENYYYYSYSSSSVYETRVNSEGKTETSRQESSDLKTNIPGLTDNDFLDRRSNRGGMTTYFYFEE